MVDVIDRKQIAIKYIKGWFFIDLISIVPLDEVIKVMSSVEDQQTGKAGSANIMMRTLRIGRMYKLLRLMRLVKFLKILKNRENPQALFSKKLQINAGTERLIAASVLFTFFLHIFSCLFVLIGQFQAEIYRDNWLDSQSEKDMFEIYIYSSYFIVTTMTTVGYGDQSANTTPERIFISILMICGVIVFTFISGALSSILSTQDASNAALQEKILFLNKLTVQYKIDGMLKSEIRQALKYDNKTTVVGMDAFIESLPPHLNMAVTLALHQKIFNQHPLLKKMNNKRLMAYMGSRFRPQFTYAGTYLYRQGDEISQLTIVISGLAAFVAPKYRNQIFAVVSKKNLGDNEETAITLKHLGCEDSVVNHLLLIKDIEQNDYDTIDLDRRTN